MPTTNKWLPLAITQQDLSGGFKIVLTTDIASHLYLYWTDKVPWVHRVSKIDRGLAIPWDAYWCYVVWTLIDQQEPGDTTIHTYTWLGWQVCQTKYFRFHGTIAGNTSPSDSPIFHKHYSYVPPEIILQEHFDLAQFPDITGIYGVNWGGYAYQAEASYTLDHIVNYFTVRELPSLLLVNIHNAGDNYWPVGDPLASASIDKSGLEAWPNYKQKSIPLSGAPIVAGQKYAVTMHILEEPPTYGWAVWHSKAPNPYKMLSSNDGGETWSVGNAVWQTMFENWGG